MKKRFLKLIVFSIAVLFFISACKVNVDTPEPEPAQPAKTTTKPAPTPTPNPDPEPEVRYELKTGPQVREVLQNCWIDTAVSFTASSEEPPESKNVYYLDIEEKNVVIWADKNKVYYFAEGVTNGDQK